MSTFVPIFLTHICVARALVWLKLCCTWFRTVLKLSVYGKPYSLPRYAATSFKWAYTNGSLIISEWLLFLTMALRGLSCLVLPRGNCGVPTTRWFLPIKDQTPHWVFNVLPLLVMLSLQSKVCKNAPTTNPQFNGTTVGGPNPLKAG